MSDENNKPPEGDVVGPPPTINIADLAAKHIKLMNEVHDLVWNIYAEYGREPQKITIDENYIISAVKTHVRQRMAHYDLNKKYTSEARELVKLRKTPEGKKLLEDMLRQATKQGLTK